MGIGCDKCGSTRLHKKGIYQTNSGHDMQRYKCGACGFRFSVSLDGKRETKHRKVMHKGQDLFSNSFDEEIHNGLNLSQKYVITSAVNDSYVNENFFNSLKLYCKKNQATLIVVPIKYNRNGAWNTNIPMKWADCLQDYLHNSNTEILPDLKLYAALNVNPAIENPISGFEGLSKGSSIIIPHPQLQMKSIAVNVDAPSAIITTTGCVTEPVYTTTKQGEKANLNHSFSALVVENDELEGCFHVRVLNAADDGSFCDINGEYTPNEVKPLKPVLALITGDEHALFNDPKVKRATYTAPDSIVNTLKPKLIVRHDVLDFYSASHHHKKNVFVNFAKNKDKRDCVEDELKLTLNYLKETTPVWAKSLIVDSNHNQHLTRWLNECDPKTEPQNALLYHKLMYQVLSKTVSTENGVSYPNPFEIWVKDQDGVDNIEFLGSSYMIGDVEVAQHGDRGANGARGNIVSFGKAGPKMVVGHSHSPGIDKGAYQVGTSSYLRMDYNSGLSSWIQCHCVIYSNNKRQLINIINGKWRV